MKNEITEQMIWDDYNSLKRGALKHLEQGNMEVACEYIAMAANFMYQCNLIYADDELENMLQKIRKNLWFYFDRENLIDKEDKQWKNNNGIHKLVFYDYFVLDNRGLTEQYVDALKEFDGKVLFISCQKDSQKSKHILEKLETAVNVVVYNVKKKSNLGKAMEVWDVVRNFHPEKFLAHTSPSDVSGLLVADMLEGKCQRFLINLTDHAFWLGKNCFDYFFEFRSYGYNISRLYRKISVDKLLHLPYYPIVNISIPFRNFDFETKGKTIILSGGTMYKIQGSDFFLELVSWILDNFPNTIFLYLGSGNKEYFNEFIKRKQYENRFFYGEERDDIYEVFKHCDLYLNTYPISGALMVQYAAVCGKIPITFAKKLIHTDSDINELFYKRIPIQIQFDNIDNLKGTIRKYIEGGKDLLRNDGEKLKDAVIKKELFQKMLYEYLEIPKNQIAFEEYNIDIRSFFKSYRDRFNEYKKSYYRCFLNKKYFSINFNFKKYFLWYLFSRQ